MRISDMTTDAALDALCEIAEPLSEIIADTSLADALKRKVKLEEGASRMEVWTALLGQLSKVIPIVLKTHRRSVYEIVAAINGKSYEELKAQNILKTMGEIREIATDKAFFDFFRSARDTGNE